MPRGKAREVIERNYPEELKAVEEKIEKLTSELKEAKIHKKELEKDKIAYDKKKAEEKKQEELKKIVGMINSSGKSLEEIEAFLKKNDNN